MSNLGAPPEFPPRASTSTLAVVLALAALGLLVGLFVWHLGAAGRQTTSHLARLPAVPETQANAPIRGWQQVAMIPVGVASPRGVAVAGDEVHVLGEQALRVYDTGFRPEGEERLEGPVLCTAADARQRVLGYRDHVRVVEANGLARDWPGLGPRAYLTALLLLGDALWIADSGNRIIWRYSRGGQLLGRIGSPDAATGYPGLIAPSPHLDLARAPDGTVLVNNPGKLRVERYTPEGELLGTVGRPGTDLDGFCGCCNPIAIAALPDGRIVAAEKGLVRVKVIGKDGSAAAVALSPPLSRLADSLDVAVTASGDVLVLDPPAGLLRVYREPQRQQQNPKGKSP